MVYKKTSFIIRAPVNILSTVEYDPLKQGVADGLEHVHGAIDGSGRAERRDRGIVPEKAFCFSA